MNDILYNTFNIMQYFFQLRERNYLKNDLILILEVNKKLNFKA